MPDVAIQNGEVILRDGLVGLGLDCCCDGSEGSGSGDTTEPCEQQLCCDIVVLLNSLGYLLDPYRGSGVECNQNGEPVRGYTFVEMTDGQCGNGDPCTFDATYYWTATFTLRTTGVGAPCYEVDNPSFDDVVFTAINCPCENVLTDITFFGHDNPGC